MGIWVDSRVCAWNIRRSQFDMAGLEASGGERRTIRGFLGTSRFSCGREGGGITNAKEQSLSYGVGDIAKEKEQSTYRKVHDPATQPRA